MCFGSHNLDTEANDSKHRPKTRKGDEFSEYIKKGNPPNSEISKTSTGNRSRKIQTNPTSETSLGIRSNPGDGEPKKIRHKKKKKSNDSSITNNTISSTDTTQMDLKPNLSKAIQYPEYGLPKSFDKSTSTIAPVSLESFPISKSHSEIVSESEIVLSKKPSEDDKQSLDKVPIKKPSTDDKPLIVVPDILEVPLKQTKTPKSVMLPITKSLNGDKPKFNITAPVPEKQQSSKSLSTSSKSSQTSSTTSKKGKRRKKPKRTKSRILQPIYFIIVPSGRNDLDCTSICDIDSRNAMIPTIPSVDKSRNKASIQFCRDSCCSNNSISSFCQCSDKSNSLFNMSNISPC